MRDAVDPREHSNGRQKEKQREFAEWTAKREAEQRKQA